MFFLMGWYQPEKPGEVFLAGGISTIPEGSNKIKNVTIRRLSLSAPIQRGDDRPGDRANLFTGHNVRGD
jgi:hypothetical protein